jgi:protein involved in polysaccharide export with SLBB domain
MVIDSSSHRVSNTVTVIGEVKRARTHTFQDELSLEDYVDLSAGFTRRADEGGIYIVKGKRVSSEFGA